MSTICSKCIEEVVSDAAEALQATGTLDVEEWAARFPEHADELRRLLPVVLMLDKEARWQEVEERTNTFAMNLIRKAVPGA